MKTYTKRIEEGRYQGGGAIYVSFIIFREVKFRGTTLSV